MSSPADRAPRSDEPTREPTREERGTLDLFARLPVGSQPVGKFMLDTKHPLPKLPSIHR